MIINCATKAKWQETKINCAAKAKSQETKN